MLKFEKNIDIDKCIYCGRCLYNCPLYENTRDQVFSARGKIIALKNGLKDNIILTCAFCDKCIEQCPLKIDIGGYLLLKFWQKPFYRINTKFNSRLHLLLSKGELVWKKNVKETEINKDIELLVKTDIIYTDSPLYFQFLRKLKFYGNLRADIKFVHPKGRQLLPSFMKGYAKKGDKFTDHIFYDEEK